MSEERETFEEWRKAYDERIEECSGITNYTGDHLDEKTLRELYDQGDAGSEAADEDMSYWTD